MKVSAIREDNVVIVDGVARTVDLSGLLQAGDHALQYDDVAEIARIELANAAGHNIGKRVADFDQDVQPIVDAWVAAAPPAVTPPTADEIADGLLGKPEIKALVEELAPRLAVTPAELRNALRARVKAEIEKS